MRPKQWPKNGFLLAALVFDRQLLHWEYLGRSIAALLLFCLLSSAIYIYNDIRDITADRKHPTKRFRPIAAGELSLPAAYLAAIILLGIVFPISYLLSPQFFYFTFLYMLLSLAYSIWLKHLPIVDIIVLASFYVVRVGAGVVVVQVAQFSPWLFVFTTFLALFLGVGKRRAELSLLAGGPNVTRKSLGGYSLPLLDQWITITSTLTIMTYSLYTFFGPGMPPNHWMMLTIPFVIYGVFRYMFLVLVEQCGGSPEEVLISDRPLQAAIGLWGAGILLLYYVFYNA